MESVKETQKSTALYSNDLENPTNFQNESRFPLIHTENFTVLDSKNEEINYTLTLLKFSNAWQLFLTHSGNVSTWVCSSPDVSQSGLYSTRVLLGDRTKEHYQVYSRSGIKILCDRIKEVNKTNQYSPIDDTILLMALDIKEESNTTFTQIIEKLNSTFEMLIK